MDGFLVTAALPELPHYYGTSRAVQTKGGSSSDWTEGKVRAETWTSRERLQSKREGRLQISRR
jgi:hypothetical protein